MIRPYRFYVVFLLLAAAAGFIHFHQEATIPTNRPLLEIPSHHLEWRMTSEIRFDPKTLEVLKPTDYVSRVYQGENGERVTFYVGYHSGGKESGPIHSPKHCLPGSGWSCLLERQDTVQIWDVPLPLVRSVYQRGDQSKELFLYWFQVRGKSLTNEYALKISEILNSILYNRKDAAFIRISIPFQENEEKAFATGSRFIRDFYPFIKEFLPN